MRLVILFLLSAIRLTAQQDTLRYASPAAVGMDSTFLADSIEAIVQEALSAKAFPGVQVLVAKDGKIVFHKAWGYHTYDRLSPVQLDDIYDFASITKVAASLPAIMKLYETGYLRLDDPLKNYYPEFQNSNKADLTLRRMLTHSAGLKAWIPFWRNTLRSNGSFRWWTFKRDSSRCYPLRVAHNMYLHKNYREKIFRAIKKSPVTNDSAYLYSDLSYYLYPDIVERLSGQPFEQFLKDSFYHPLRANTLTFNAYRYFPLTRIIPTERDTFFRMEQIHGRVHDEGAIMLGGISGHAGLFGSAKDLAKLFQMYLNGGSYGGRRYLKESTLALFTSCVFCDEHNRRGLGFDKPSLEYNAQKSSTAKDASPATFGHGGYTGTLVWADPKYDLLYIFLSNRVYPTRTNRLLYELNIRPRIHQVLYEAMEE